MQKTVHNLKKLTLPNNLWFILGLLFLISLRLFHLGELIDGGESPSNYIQSDRACYALNFYRDGINLLEPVVCWLGGHPVLLNFPLPEAIAAVGYKLLGGPSIIFARLVTFSFFLGSVYYLFVLVEYLGNVRLAKLTVVVYMVLPIGLLYSRAAVHFDFPTIFFAYAMLYYLLRGYDENKLQFIALGAILGIFGFLIKAPYVFYLFLPYGFYVLRNLKMRLLLKSLPFLALPMIFFLLWRYYTTEINSLAPDLFFIPGYFKFVDMEWWYYGTLTQRLTFSNWSLLGERFFWYVISPVGVYLFTMGLFVQPRNVRSITFFRLWLVGLLTYLFIFFNLNVVHDYYQIPFLAIVAFFIAVSIDSIFLADRPPRVNSYQKLPVLITLCFLIGNCIWIAEKSFYSIAWDRVSAGKIIRQYTPERSLIIASTSYTDPRDPRLLYEAQRNGWPVKTGDLSQSLIQALMDEGAEYLAIVSTDQITGEWTNFLTLFPKQTFFLNDNTQLYLYALNGANIDRVTAAESPPRPLNLEKWKFSDLQPINTGSNSYTFRVTGEDPILRSPILTLEAKDYSFVTAEVEVLSPVECRTFTLYFTRNDTPTESEKRAIHIKFDPYLYFDSSKESLIIVANVRSHPEWQGNITNIRLDPVCGLNSDGSEVNFQVEAVTLQ